MNDFDRDSMLDVFIFEMLQLIGLLEQIVVDGDDGYSADDISEIFRIMHTIKGSAAMMQYDGMSEAAHAIEDMFFYIREKEAPQGLDYAKINDLVLEGMDFIKEEIEKLENGVVADGSATYIKEQISEFMKKIKQDEDVPVSDESTTKNTPSLENNVHGTYKYKYKALMKFNEQAGMDNVRAFTVVNNNKDFMYNLTHEPADLFSEASAEIIAKNGVEFQFETNKKYDEVKQALENTSYLQEFTLDVYDNQLSTDGEGSRSYNITLRFDEGAEMENVRAYTVVHNLEPITSFIVTTPKDLIDENSAKIIRKDGLKLNIKTHLTYEELVEHLDQTIFLRELNIEAIEVTDEKESTKAKAKKEKEELMKRAPVQQMISVQVGRLDNMLKLMGELVIAEAMVTQNPDLENLQLDSFEKETRQLRKIIDDLQTNVMSMRMVPLSTTFFKMHRVVRDMTRNLGKEVKLDISGEDTEVDKNITEHLSDPLLHIIRNAVDHGIEMPEDREKTGKSREGVIKLMAYNSGSDVYIEVSDNGKGLDKEQILNKAEKNGLLKKSREEYTDKEAYQFVLAAGFSTSDEITSYSGRGVGMDVVIRNLEEVGGSVMVDSIPGEGTTFTMKIPLTIAIIKGMTFTLNEAKFTVPISHIRDSFRPVKENIFYDPEGNEMITLRDEVYNVVRLYEFFDLALGIEDPEQSIMMLLENGHERICLMVDEIIGEHQVVVKSMPSYINRVDGVSGCTLLGNGEISLILDVAGFFN